MVRKGKSKKNSATVEESDDPDFLDEDFTIASSIATLESAFDDADDEEYRHDAVSHHESAQSAAAARQTQLQEVLAATVQDYSSEKRTAHRQTRLKRLYKALTQLATGEAGTAVVENFIDSMFTTIQHALRSANSTPSEHYAACRVIEAVSIVLGADNDAWVERLWPLLQRVVNTTQRAPAVRQAAVRAWSVSVFVGSTEVDSTEALLTLWEQVAGKEFRNEETPVSVRAAALDGWALLASSSLSDEDLAGEENGRGLVLLPLINEALAMSSNDARDLRSAAGQCLALIHETRLRLGNSEGENVTARRYQKGSWKGSESEEIIEVLAQQLKELSTQSGHQLSKKAKKAQRATFREYLSTVEDGEAPEEVIHLKERNGAQVTITSWRLMIQVQWLRHSLQSGFQVQLLTNGTIQAILGAEGLDLQHLASNMSSLDKRLILSKTSEGAKAEDRRLTKNRDRRERYKNDFLYNDLSSD